MNQRSAHIVPITLSILTLLIGLFLVLTGCGRKTPPVPPETTLPKTINDLHQQLNENGVTLTWTAPSRTIQGDRLEHIDGFELMRAIVPDDDYCEGCPINFGRPIKIKAGKSQPGDTMHYHETVLRPGHRYFYKVRTKLGWYHAGADSNIVSFAWNTLISAPTNLAASTGDRRITLAWKAPTTLIDNSKLSEELHYQIFRSVAGDEPAPVGSPIDTTTFTDLAVENNTTYIYNVQPLSKNSVGLMSKPVSVNSRDQTPPAPPSDLIAVQTQDGIKILWQQPNDPDLSGYRIYRRMDNENKTTMIGEAKKGVLMFLDTTALAPAVWYYSVSAIDDAEPANESKHLNEIKFTTK